MPYSSADAAGFHSPWSTTAFSLRTAFCICSPCFARKARSVSDARPLRDFCLDDPLPVEQAPVGLAVGAQQMARGEVLVADVLDHDQAVLPHKGRGLLRRPAGDIGLAAPRHGEGEVIGGVVALVFALD